MNFVFLALGLIMLLVGANYIVDASVAIAKRAKISDFVIGLTIIGMGTSAPELLISVSSSLEGMGDVAIGNVIGSNICNIMLILGVAAIISPIAIERSNIRRDIPLGIIVSLGLAVLCYLPVVFGGGEPSLSRWSGIFLLVCFGLFIYSIFIKGKGKDDASYDDSQNTKLQKLPIWLLILISLLSLGVLLYGGNLFLKSSVNFAKEIGMSDSVIAITIIAVGTSLPELITCVVSAIKGNSQMALGNVLGSNIFNILLILGVSSTISPLTMKGIGLIDFGVLLVAAVLTFVFAFTLKRYKIDRAEGLLFVALYVGYTAYLLMQ